jgi:Ni,Fe-hydrogenase III large subunit
MSAKKAIQIAKKTGNLGDALIEALRGQRIYDIKEAAEKQTQVWHVPNQAALNRFTLSISDKLPDVTFTVADATVGYEVTVSGEYCAQDVASLSAGIGGVSRIDGPNNDLK